MSCLSNLKFIFMPDYWSSNYPFSEEWDAELKYLMTKHTFKYVDSCTATLGDTEVWIENYPYACMKPWRPLNGKYVMPSKDTIYKAYKKYKHDISVHSSSSSAIDDVRYEVKALASLVRSNHDEVLKAVTTKKRKK